MNTMHTKSSWLLVIFTLALAISGCAAGEVAAPGGAPIESPPPTVAGLPSTASPTPTPEPTPTLTPIPGLDPAAADNMTYDLAFLTNALPESKGQVTLKDGLFEYQYPDSAESVSIRKIMEARGDLNGDGAEDAVVLLAVSTGGTGTFMNLAAVLNEDRIPRHVATKFIGDRTKLDSLAIADGMIYLRGLAHGPNDPACCPSQKLDEQYQLQDDLLVTAEQSEVLPLAENAIQALKAKDMQALAELVDPNTGVRFSPYSFVQRKDLTFTPEQLQSLLDDPEVYNWGNFDGSGEPIQMSFAEYFDRFVYSKDFAGAEQIGINQRLGAGNTLDNSLEFYPEAVVVEYHIPGENPEYGGMDWQSLRLVFQQIDGAWRLAGIIHDEWTT